MSKVIHSILSVGLTLISVDGAHAQSNECPLKVGESIANVSIVTIQDLLEVLPISKSEFETQEIFNQKQAAFLAENNLLDVRVFETVADRSRLKYVAEEEVFYFDDYLFSNGYYGPSSDLKTEILELTGRYDYQNAQGISHRVYDNVELLETYVATFGTGAVLEVPKVQYVNVTIFGDHELDEDALTIDTSSFPMKKIRRYYGYEPVQEVLAPDENGKMVNEVLHSVAVPIEDARTFSEQMQTFTVARLTPPYFATNSYIYEPELSNPEERVISNYAIRADIICSALVNSGGTVASILTPMSGYLEYATQ